MGADDYDYDSSSGRWQGYSYNPAEGAWSIMPAFEKRGNDMDSYYSLNQVGGKIVIWSRQYNINGDVYRVVHGGVYDPENNLWSPISSIGSPVMSGVDMYVLVLFPV